MPYEVATEKAPVVFDFGKKYTKCGFAGEHVPRCIVPSEIKRTSTGKIFKLSSNHSENSLYEGLCDFIYSLYMTKLLVNAKERRVILVESLFSPTLFRNVLGKVFFKQFEVPSVFFGSSHVFGAFTVGMPTCLILDSGFDCTTILPVLEYTPIIKAAQILPLAASSIHQNLEALIKEKATVVSGKKDKTSILSYVDHIDEYFLEDIKIRGCFVNRMDRAEKNRTHKFDSTIELPNKPPSFDYSMNGEIIIRIDGSIRESACETLFEFDISDSSIASILIEAILKSPVDSRKILSENIILMGGTCMQPGFKDRLAKELMHLTSTKYKNKMGIQEFKFHNPPSKENFTAWLGGAIFGTTDIVAMKSLSIETYNTLQRVPDWCNLLDLNNIKEELVRLQQQPKVYRSQRKENIRNTASNLLVPII